MTPEEEAEPFGPTHVVAPTTTHTHTAIILHGRGDTGPEFAEELLTSILSDGKTLQALLPGWRWVFPSSPEFWSSVFQEHMPAWFEAHSLTDPSARQDLQAPGLLVSVRHVSAVVEEEIGLLGGRAERVVLGGISQGGAVGMWALLSHGARPFGAFFAASTWLPFAQEGEDVLSGRKEERPGQDEKGPRDAVLSMLAERDRPASGHLQTPVLLMHGNDDAYVDVELGREAARILGQAGYNVAWREYTGAEQEGHWFKAPEGFDDICSFLVKATMRGA